MRFILTLFTYMLRRLTQDEQSLVSLHSHACYLRTYRLMALDQSEFYTFYANIQLAILHLF